VLSGAEVRRGSVVRVTTCQEHGTRSGFSRRDPLLMPLIITQKLSCRALLPRASAFVCTARLVQTPRLANRSRASPLRAALALRSSESAAPAVFAGAVLDGVAGTDAFLCRLGQSIASALRTVPEGAEAARAQLREMRGTLHAAIDARCDDLEAGLSLAESSKIAALERELVAVDAALERWRSETRVVQEAVASLSDDELLSRHADLAVSPG